MDIYDSYEDNSIDSSSLSPLLSLDWILFLFLLPLLLQSFYKSCSFMTLFICWCGSFLTLTFNFIYLQSNPKSSLVICYLFLLLQGTVLYNNEYSYLSHFLEYGEYEKSSLRNIQHTTMLSLEKKHIEKVIGSIAHDLRTPMQSLQLDLNSLIEMILTPQSGSLSIPPTGQQQTVGNPITYAVNDVFEMVTIVEDLHDTLHFMFASVNRGVDYCKIDSGTPLIQNKEIVDYHLCVTNAIALVSRSIANGTKIHQYTRYYDPRNKFINTDKSWLFENLICLISNAVKYSSGGDVSVYVDLVDVVPPQICFTVENNSTNSILIGMNIKDSTAIFQDFSVSHRTSGGAGLGLFILATRVKVLGGEYGCETKENPCSNEENGSINSKYLTRFWFTLPLHSFHVSEKNQQKESADAAADAVGERSLQRKLDGFENQRLQNFLISSRLNFSRDDDDSNSIFSIRTLDFSRIEQFGGTHGGSETSGRKYSVVSAPGTVYEEEVEDQASGTYGGSEASGRKFSAVSAPGTVFEEELEDHSVNGDNNMDLTHPVITENEPLNSEGQDAKDYEQKDLKLTDFDHPSDEPSPDSGVTQPITEYRRKSESKGVAKPRFWKMNRKVHSANDLRLIDPLSNPTGVDCQASPKHVAEIKETENSIHRKISFPLSQDEPPHHEIESKISINSLALSNLASLPDEGKYSLNISGIQDLKDQSSALSPSSPMYTPKIPPQFSTISRDDDCSTSRTPKLILVVDDSTVIQKSTKRSLQRAGYEVEIADNGLNALNMMKQKLYSAVLMDIEMPVMGGIEATQKLREFEQTENILITNRQKIIGVTASTDSSTRDKALSAGMNEFIHKPFQLELIQTIFVRLVI